MSDDSTAGPEETVEQAVAPQVLEVTPGGTSAFWLQFTATKDPNGDGFEMDVTGVPNTNPSGGHFVAVWQANGSVPWGALTGALRGKATMSAQDPDFGFPFTSLNLGNMPYVLAYSTGSDATNFNNIAAAMPFGAGGTPGQLQATTLQLVSAVSTSLLVDYTTPIGTDPALQGHSLALVKGGTFIPGRTRPIATATPTDNAVDSASFNLTPTPLQSGQAYTVAYLTGKKVDPNNPQNQIPDPATVAATVQFTVS
jgi:hypothetical protein